MKQVRMIIGSIVAITGIGTILFSAHQLLLQQFIWIPIALLGAALTITGICLMTGNHIRHTLKDLASMLMWWNP